MRLMRAKRAQEILQEKGEQREKKRKKEIRMPGFELGICCPLRLWQRLDLQDFACINA